MSEEYKEVVTLNERGIPVLVTHGDIKMPPDYSFESVNHFVNCENPNYEELQYLALGMSNEIEHLQLQAALASQAQQPTVTDEMIAAAETVEDLYRRGTPDTWKKVFLAMWREMPSVQSQAHQTESQWISVDEAKSTLKDGDLIFAYCEFYGVIEATYAFEEGYYNPHRIVKKNGDSYRINIFTHIMVRKPVSLPPASEVDKP